MCSVSGQSCLGPMDQSRRLRLSIGLLALSLSISVVLIELGLSWPYRLSVFIPFLFTAMGAYQGLYKT